MSSPVFHICDGCGEEFSSTKQFQLFCPTCSIAPIRLRVEKQTVRRIGNERNHESKIRDKHKRKRKADHYIDLR